jgi:hypothetical protein
VKDIAAAARVKVSADGHGVVSHAGMAMVRELADRTGLSAQVTAALADTYRGPWVYAPGDVFADLAAAVADGADCIDAVGQLCGDREHVFGAKASTTTMWRLIDERIDAAHLPAVRAARGRRGLSRSSDYPDVFGLLLVVACSRGMDVGIIRGRSEGFEERDELIRWLVSSECCRGRGGSVQGFLFEVKIGMEINAGGVHFFVAEPPYQAPPPHTVAEVVWSGRAGWDYTYPGADTPHSAFWADDPNVTGHPPFLD